MATCSSTNNQHQRQARTRTQRTVLLLKQLQGVVQRPERDFRDLNNVCLQHTARQANFEKCWHADALTGKACNTRCKLALSDIVNKLLTAGLHRLSHLNNF